MPRKQVPNAALGAEEAAGVMGVHYTQPGKRVQKGLLSCRYVTCNEAEDRAFAVYSLKECEEDFADYEETYKAGKGRPRTKVEDREHVLKRLLSEKNLIDYDDAISVAEAAEILGMVRSGVQYLLAQEKIVARKIWGERSNATVFWIVSKKSCEQHAAATAKLEKAGKKAGRPRTGTDL